jgi:hypothetical protein
MKNYTIAWRPFTTLLNGDEVAMQLLPLKRKEMFEITPLLAKHGEVMRSKAEGEIPQEVFEITEALLDKVSPWIDLHVKEIKGFLVNEGEPKASDLIQEAAFANFILGVVMELFTRSTMKEQEVRD